MVLQTFKAREHIQNYVFIYLEKYDSELNLLASISSACNAQGHFTHFAHTNSSCSLLSTDMQVGHVTQMQKP